MGGCQNYGPLLGPLNIRWVPYYKRDQESDHNFDALEARRNGFWPAVRGGLGGPRGFGGREVFSEEGQAGLEGGFWRVRFWTVSGGRQSDLAGG